jgi:hypothetical protein
MGFMALPDRPTVLKVLREAAGFTKRVGAEPEARELERYCGLFEDVKPTFKLLRGKVQDAMDNAYRAFEPALYTERRNIRRGKKPLVDEYERIWVAWRDEVAYPPRVVWRTVPTTRFAGSKGVLVKSADVIGKPIAVRPIFERSVAVVNQYCHAIVTHDYASAYNLLASEMKAWMSFKRFLSDLERADRRFGGKPISFTVERVSYIYGDDEASSGSNREGDWPKDTPKQNKRAIVVVFWTNNASTQEGCWGTLWITEESRGYRIAKLSHFLQ